MDGFVYCESDFADCGLWFDVAVWCLECCVFLLVYVSACFVCDDTCGGYVCLFCLQLFNSVACFSFFVCF